MGEKKFVIFFITACAIILVIFALAFNGTADSGDSIMHYQFARYAFDHRYNFFNTWAKPLFVLLAAPFAQAGFIGIKIFNIINLIIAMISAWLIAQRLNMDNSWLVPVLLIVAPMSFALSLSGLTEPLFASLLVSGLCLLFYNRNIPGLILLSFLPFVRSEGLFLLLPILAYLLVQKRYTSVLWLCTGQIVYAIIGYFHFHSFLWFYEGNPYSLISKYGKGDLKHYFINMPITIGPATCFLLATGFITIPAYLVKKQENKTNALPLLLIWVLFTLYFFFHVIAWKFGLFASFGMVRIISAVTPLIVIIAVYGYNKAEEYITRFLKKSNGIGRWCIGLILLINLVYMAVKVNRNAGTSGLDITLNADQVIETQIAAYIKQKYPDYKNRPVFFNAPYLSLVLDIDPTDAFKNPTLTCKDENYPPNSLYIWDDWYSVVERGITPESLGKTSAMKKDTSFSQIDKGGKMRTVALYRKE
ncbi:MAG: hypothetical protein ACLQQ4_13945 [Bacteroidia bacterium]